MLDKEYLESIIEEAQELLDHALAGGDRERAFDQMISTNELHSAFNNLFNTNTDIKDELAS